MKTLSTQIIYFLRQRPSRMNIANLLLIGTQEAAWRFQKIYGGS